MIKWLPYFYKEIEKISNLPGLAFGGMAAYDLKTRVGESKGLNKLEPAKAQEEQLQLPGSNSFDFSGGKRIDSSSAMTATNKY